MSASSSLSAATMVFVQLVLFDGISPLSPKVESVSEPAAQDFLGDVSDHPEFPTLFYRDIVTLTASLPCVFSGIGLNLSLYRFDYLNRNAGVEFFPLDNPPVDPSVKTSLGEAVRALNTFWGHGLCPLDYFSFKRIINNEAREMALLEILKKHYIRYHSVYILFTDPIHLGQSQENYYLVYELRYGFEYAHLTVMHESKLISLFAGETVIAACVSCKDVFMRSEFEVGVEQSKVPDAQHRGEVSLWDSIVWENQHARRGLPTAV